METEKTAEIEVKLLRFSLEVVMQTRLDQLVEDFALTVIRQDNAETVDEGNRYARERSKVFDELITHGDDGREALVRLFDHEDLGVRCMAAVYLLGYKHAEAVKVLEELAKGRGMNAFGAQQSLKNWESGDWEVDPEYLPPNHASRAQRSS
jgi:hypothetical protein